jgi:CPA2 family monovalent cation:H+ antiporter-2
MVLKKYIPSVEVYVRQRLDFDQNLEAENMRNHIVICGYGRVGAEVGKALFLANIPFIAIDYNFTLVQKARREGIHIIYGDPTQRDVLDYAQVDQAAILLSAVPEKYAQESIILNAKKLNPKIIIISRVHRHDHQKRMRNLGADIVVQPEMEASLSIIKKIFAFKKLPKEEIVRRLRFFKLEQGGI